MSGNDIFDELDDRSVEPSFGSGDYADWWEPDEEGEQLVGIIVEMHSEPEEWTEPGDVPGTVNTVMSLGRGDFETGHMLTPKQHKQLQNGLGNAGLMDLVNLTFTGYEKVQGNLMNTYKVGVIPEEEWKEMDGADDIADLVEEHRAEGGIFGDNRRTEPYQAEPSSDGGTATQNTAPSGGADDELVEAAEFLKDFVQLQNGHASIEQVEKMLFEVREYDVDLEAALSMAGLTEDDGEISA